MTKYTREDVEEIEKLIKVMEMVSAIDLERDTVKLSLTTDDIDDEGVFDATDVSFTSATILSFLSWAMRPDF